MRVQATGILAAAPIAWLIACNSGAGPTPAPPPESPPAPVAAATSPPTPPPTPRVPEPAPPAAPPSEGAWDDKVRSLVQAKGTRPLCNDLNGCPLVDELVAFGRDAAPAIERAFRDSRGDAYWRFRLIEAVGRIAAPSSEPFLVTLLQRDPDPPARIEAAYGLGRGRYTASLPVLRAVVTVEPAPPTAVILASAYALATLGDPLGVELIDRHLVVPDSPTVPTPTGAPEPGGGANEPNNVFSRFEMRWDPLRPGVYAAGELRLKALRPRLEALAQRADPFVRREAIRALAKLRDPQVVPALIAALSDSVPGNRAEALESLRTLTGQRHKVRAEDWRRWWATQPGAAVDSLPSTPESPPTAPELPEDGASRGRKPDGASTP